MNWFKETNTTAFLELKYVNGRSLYPNNIVRTFRSNYVTV